MIVEKITKKIHKIFRNFVANESKFVRGIALPGQTSKLALSYVDNAAATHVAVLSLAEALSAADSDDETLTSTLDELLARDAASCVLHVSDAVAGDDVALHDLAASSGGSLLCCALSNGAAPLYDTRSGSVLHTLTAERAAPASDSVDTSETRTHGFSSVHFMQNGSALLLTGLYGKYVIYFFEFLCISL